jgi:prepilin-type N-terminal cleavage/methylation domain-containing protein
MKHRALGLTLIEILTVIAILGLLAAVLLPVYSNARRMGWRSETLSNLRQIGLQLAMYESDHGELPQSLSILQGANYRIPAEMLLAKSDPFKRFGSMERECVTRVADLDTSFEHNLDWPEHLKSELATFDANHGVIACRVYGARTSYFDKAQSDFCSYRNFAFEGVLLRLRKDTSVQTTRLNLSWSVQPGSSKLSPMFSVFDLYTDGFPSRVPAR